MRIAISGSHLVGKTTLAEALVETLPRHDLVPEPYRLLEEDGTVFGARPSIDDFERQLARSLRSLAESGGDTVFDRCPLDLLGYLLTHRDADAFHLDDWLSPVAEAVATLDLVVFVPVERPDRVAVPRSEARLRAEVDALLREIVADDAYGLEIDGLTVRGTPTDRLRRVTRRLDR